MKSKDWSGLTLWQDIAKQKIEKVKIGLIFSLVGHYKIQNWKCRNCLGGHYKIWNVKIVLDFSLGGHYKIGNVNIVLDFSLVGHYKIGNVKIVLDFSLGGGTL